jgi:hypothetical protein
MGAQPVAGDDLRLADALRQALGFQPPSQPALLQSSRMAPCVW